MFAKLLSTKSTAEIHVRQQEMKMWADEAMKNRPVGLSQTYNGKMVRTASKHSEEDVRLWRGFCLKEFRMRKLWQSASFTGAAEERSTS